MEKTKGIDRAQFLTGAAAFGAAALLPAGRAEATGGGEGRVATGAEAARRGAEAAGRGLRRRGVVYTVGEGETPATAFSTARMRADLRAVRDDLHADTVDVTGDGVERLTATAAEAAELGLHVWLQPTLGDVPERDILEHLAESGRFAERLRRQGASVELSVGCEFWLFVPGIIPGANVFERIENLQNGTVDRELMQRRLDRFTAKAAKTGRSVFRGRLSYAAAQDDRVDWNLFDVVGIDYYSYFRERERLREGVDAVPAVGQAPRDHRVRHLRVRRRAPDGRDGLDIVDYDKNPPEIKGDLVRSERVQAAYLTDLLDVFESMGLYAAMAFEFVTADAPHRPDDPRHDVDLASYGITKAIKDRPDDPRSDWHWEPKEAFHALARRYGRRRAARA
ncbi:hypothetical protein SALBM311S_10423 [Streptomyces alboniger]